VVKRPFPTPLPPPRHQQHQRPFPLPPHRAAHRHRHPAAARYYPQSWQHLCLPVPIVYDGDRLTIQIMPTVPDAIVPESVSVHVLFNGEEMAVGTLANRNLAGQPLSLFEWVTTAMAGSHEIRVILDRDNRLLPEPRQGSHNEASITLIVEEAAALSRHEARSHLGTGRKRLLHHHTVSGTAAYRDLPQLVPRIETAVQTASRPSRRTALT
jgi:hypothetical protein